MVSGRAKSAALAPLKQHCVYVFDPAGGIEKFGHPRAAAVAAVGQPMAAGREHQFVQRVCGRNMKRDIAMVLLDGVPTGSREQRLRRRDETPGRVASSTTCELRVMA